MKKVLFFLCLLGLIPAATPVRGEGRGDEVIVVYNRRVAESKGVAEHYAFQRRVPAGQVLGLDLPATETMSRVEFRDQLQKPLLKALEEKGLWSFGPLVVPATNGAPERIEQKVVQAPVRHAGHCYGVPLKIAEDTGLYEEGMEKIISEFRRNYAAVDSELACLPKFRQKMLLTGTVENSLYGRTNSAAFNPTNGIFLVARLDGPTAAIARGLVDKAMQAETEGLWGRAYFDLRNIFGSVYEVGDMWIRRAANICESVGFETIIDTNAATFPASFPLSQVAFYAGWYDGNASGPFTRPQVEFMPGAFAYHLHSYSAATLRSTTQNWVGPLLAKGATASMGCVNEPYLTGTPNMNIFFACFAYWGLDFGEAAYSSQGHLSWQTTVVGDPLYRPLARPPLAQHEELLRRHSKWIEWSYLRLVNLKLSKGLPLAEGAAMLEDLPPARDSAVLQEKLADLYSQLGKPSSSVFALQQVLKLNPTPQQKIRVMLELANRLSELGKDQEAYGVCRQFLKAFPDYPDPLAIYKQLRELAQKLGKTGDAETYQHQIARLAPPPG